MQRLDALALTSAQAVASGAAARLLARHGATPLWIVGARTLEAARRAGFSGAAVLAPDAATLVAAIAKIAPRPERALYLAGVNRKSTLEEGLTALGVAVTLRECYAAREAAILSVEAEAALREGAVDAALHLAAVGGPLVAAAAQAALAALRLPACLSVRGRRRAVARRRRVTNRRRGRADARGVDRRAQGCLSRRRRRGRDGGTNRDAACCLAEDRETRIRRGEP